MSKSDKSQGESSRIKANLLERCSRTREAERIEVNKNPSVTRESQDPSASISSAGINAESRLSVVTINMKKRKKLIFLCMPCRSSVTG